MDKSNQSDQLELIKKLPDIKKIVTKTNVKKPNWFNNSLAFLIVTIFTILGVLITFLI